MGQIAHPARQGRARWSAAASGLALLAASPLLSACGSSLASATTTLAGVVDVQVVHSDGSVVAGVNGLRVHRGDIIRTGPQGRVELLTRGRVVYAGSQASIQVENGAADDLRRGAVVVDAQNGPGLTLTVAGLTVNAASGTATRAERAATVRIGALAGVPSIDSDTGRSLRMTRLSQVVVGGDALPDSTDGSPLRLTDDDGEAHAVPTLVRDDLALSALASGIDATGAHTFRVVTAAWRQSLEPLPSGVRRSEQVLPVVIAAAARGADPQTRYAEAVALRRAGGSWGVVAHLLGTSSAAVLHALDMFDRGAATGQVGSVPAALSFLTGGAHHPTGGSASSSSNSTPSAGSTPGPRPSPSPSGSPGLVTTTIDKVLSLLPTPVPTPTALRPVLPGAAVALTPVPLPTAHH